MRRHVFAAALLVAGTTSAGAVEPPVFVDVTAASGVDHTYTGGWEYFVGGGTAVFDCNGDAYPDLFLAGGSSPSRLLVNGSTKGGIVRFVPASALPDGLDNVLGAYPLDVDGDGKLDLAVLRLGENHIYRGEGGCRFSLANDAWSFDGGNAWSTGFSATWEKTRNWPTLAVGNYVDRDQPGAPWGTCSENRLYRPAAGTYGFSNPHALEPGYCSLSVLFSDWNRSGVQALRISNDRQYYRGGQEQLWTIEAGKPHLFSKREGWRKLKIWGMGIASRDVTGDGYPEYFLTSMGDQKLRSLDGPPRRPSYRDLAHQSGVTAHRPHTGNDVLPSTGWHAQFDDVNNDGFVDLFIAKGNVEAMQDFARLDPNNLLLGRPDGTFREAASQAGVDSISKSRGSALADFNLDGLLDLIVVNREAKAQVWRNAGFGTPDRPGPAGNWVALKVEQPGANRNAVGAWIEVRAADRTQRKEITVGGGHASGIATWHHFGVGVAERLTVRVQWPDGVWSPWIRLFANQFARISRGQTEAALWLPPSMAKKALE